jgi:hypothetical protein
MGKHSSPQQFHFYRSLVGWLLPWLMIAAVVGIAVWVTVDAIGGKEVQGTPLAQTTTTSPSPKPTQASTLPASPSPSPKAKSSPSNKPSPRASKAPSKHRLITAGITVQVLNATSVADADDRMADRLASLGFDVIALDGSSKEYSQTTVYWAVASAEDAAKRLAAKFGWLAAPKPDNLSTQVSIHVVVGSDEA